MLTLKTLCIIFLVLNFLGNKYLNNKNPYLLFVGFLILIICSNIFTWIFIIFSIYSNLKILRKIKNR